MLFSSPWDLLPANREGVKLPSPHLSQGGVGMPGVFLALCLWVSTRAPRGRDRLARFFLGGVNLGESGFVQWAAFWMMEVGIVCVLVSG